MKYKTRTAQTALIESLQNRTNCDIGTEEVKRISPRLARYNGIYYRFGKKKPLRVCKLLEAYSDGSCLWKLARC